MRHHSSFGISTPRDFLRELVLPEYRAFTQRNSSARHALLTIILAYHMYEWVHGKKCTREHFKSAHSVEQQVAEYFELAAKITNGTKHFRSKAKTRRQVGFGSGFSDAFVRPLIVQFDSGREESADKFLRTLIDFWDRWETGLGSGRPEGQNRP